VSTSLMPRLSRDDWRRPSVLALIAANVFPLIGVFLFGWEVFPLLLLFWCENVIVGVFNALKMLFSSPDNAMGWAAKLFVIPFFCFHYGMFTFIHGVFVVGLFGGYFRAGSPFPGPDVLLCLVQKNHLTWAVVGLFASHAVSFVHNYLGHGEYRRADFKTLMAQPYGRIVVLHLTILGGGFLMMALKSPAIGLALLVVLKIILDLRAHLRERAKFAPTTTPA
jgi:hypothetical protein